MPLPLPDIAKEAQRVMAEMLDLPTGEWKAVGVKDVDTELNEWDEEKQMERCDDVRTNLRGDLVESEEPGEQDDKERGDAYGGIDADDHAEGEAPGHAARGDTAA